VILVFIHGVYATDIKEVRIVSAEEMDRIFGGTMLAYTKVETPVTGENDSAMGSATTEPQPVTDPFTLTSFVDFSLYHVDITGNRSQSFRDNGAHWVGLNSTSYGSQVNSNTVLNANVQFRYTDDPSVDQTANGHIQNANVTIASEQYEFQGGDVIRQYSPLSFNGTFKGASYQRRFGSQSETIIDVMGGAAQTFWNDLVDQDGPRRTLDRYVYGGRVSHAFNSNLLLGGTVYGFDDAQNSSPQNVIYDSNLGAIYLPSQDGRTVGTDLTWKYLEHYQAKAEISNSDFTADKRNSTHTFNDWSGMIQNDIEYDAFVSHVHYARFNPYYVNPFGISQNDLQEVAVQNQLRVFKPLQPFFYYRFSENNLRDQLFFATTRESYEPGFLAPDVGGVTNLNVSASFSRLKTYSNPSIFQDSTTDMIFVKPSYLVGPIRTELSVGRVLQSESISTDSRSHEWDVGGSIEGNWEYDDWRVNPMLYASMQDIDSVGIQYVDSHQRVLTQRLTIANKQIGEISGSYTASTVHRPSIQFNPAEVSTLINPSYEQTAFEIEMAPRLPENWKQVQKISLSYQAYDTSYATQNQFAFREQIWMLKFVANF
jgi:hypothetical protein